MAEGKRPGGLTALAVLNFVFGGFGVIGLLAVYALLKIADEATGGAVTKVAPGAVWASLAIGAVQVTLMIISGIGYLGQKKTMGRLLGNAWSGLAVVNAIIGIAVLKTGFGASSIVGLVYPVLTLFLLNVTFKNDFPN